MAATSHSFKTEVYNTSQGNPTFLGRHLDSLCPATQEEDEWLEQELERARQQRGTFYKKLANSRSASQRELDDISASKIRSASRGSTERELSLSPSGSTSSPPPAIPEPHSSWRFYTSFDNGEWKRHCVPVYKPEEEILKSPSTEGRERYEHSPAFESHLKKYRQARATLFDRPPSRRTYLGSSPRDEISNTMRVVTTGNDPNFKTITHHSPQTVAIRTFGEDLLGNQTSTLPTTVKQEITTSETITTVNGDPNPVKKPPTPVKDQSHGRLRHHNLGFKEKVIVPTKYKTDAEKEAIAAAKAKAAEREMAEKENKKPKHAKLDIDEPSFLGSTFEKFNYGENSLIKPSRNDSPRKKPVFDEPAGKHISIEVKSKNVPIFDNQSTAKPFPLASSSTWNEQNKALQPNPSTNESGIDVSASANSSFQSSTPEKVTKEERSSLPFQNFSNTHSVFQKPVPERPVEVNSLVSGRPAQSENVPELGTERSAFSAPNKNRWSGASDTEATAAPVIARDQQPVAESPRPTGGGVVFIPVIRVMAPESEKPPDQKSNSATDYIGKGQVLNLDEEGSPSCKPDDAPTTSQNQPDVSRVSADSAVFEASPSDPMRAGQGTVETRISRSAEDSDRGLTSSSPYSYSVKVHHHIEPSAAREKVIFPSDRSYKSQVDVVPHRGDAAVPHRGERIITPSVKITSQSNSHSTESSSVKESVNKETIERDKTDKQPDKRLDNTETENKNEPSKHQATTFEKVSGDATTTSTQEETPRIYTPTGERIIIPRKYAAAYQQPKTESSARSFERTPAESSTNRIERHDDPGQYSSTRIIESSKRRSGTRGESNPDYRTTKVITRTYSPTGGIKLTESTRKYTPSGERIIEPSIKVKKDIVEK